MVLDYECVSYTFTCVIDILVFIFGSRFCFLDHQIYMSFDHTMSVYNTCAVQCRRHVYLCKRQKTSKHFKSDLVYVFFAKDIWTDRWKHRTTHRGNVCHFSEADTSGIWPDPSSLSSWQYLVIWVHWPQPWPLCTPGWCSLAASGPEPGSASPAKFSAKFVWDCADSALQCSPAGCCRGCCTVQWTQFPASGLAAQWSPSLPRCHGSPLLTQTQNNVQKCDTLFVFRLLFIILNLSDRSSINPPQSP